MSEPLSQSSQLLPVNPVDLQSNWEEVRAGLLVVQKKASDGWIPEDIYHAIKSCTSFLYQAYVDQEYVGFIVVTPIHGYDCKKLHIWTAYNQGGKNVLEQTYPELEKIARGIGAKKITFASPRNWERRFPDWKVVTTYYEKEV